MSTEHPQPANGAPGSGASAEAESDATLGSILLDDTFVANQRAVHGGTDKRIVGGVPTSDFPECVAVGGRHDFCCTGTLIAPQAVLTAGHCVAHGCGERIYIGDRAGEDGVEVRVRKAITHPDYVPNTLARMFDDLAVLILAEPVTTVQPAHVCSPDALLEARSVRLVGYGNTNFSGDDGYGIRRMVDVGVASDHPEYGARFETEFVAGAPYLDRDSCTGDSGGPAYIDVGRWELAGATSRPTRNSRRDCGDGGIYTRVPAYRDWLESIVGPLD
jgi:secreted trypsin-like serine protease